MQIHLTWLFALFFFFRVMQEWHVEMSTQNGLVSIWMQAGLVEDQSVLAGQALAMLVGQDRMPWAPVTLPVPHPCPHSVACSLI